MRRTSKHSILCRRGWYAAALSLAACQSAAPVAVGQGPASPASKDEARETAQSDSAGAGRPAPRHCVTRGAEICFNATDDNCNGLIDEGCGLVTGLVQFVIAWDRPEADVDLYVTDPNGELVEVGRLVKSGLVKERDCPGRRHECRGNNIENVFLEEERSLLKGTYGVRIRLEKLGQAEPPVTIRFSARLGGRTTEREIQLSSAEEEKLFSFAL